MKYCPFLIDGPRYLHLYGAAARSAALSSGFDKLHTMQDWDRPKMVISSDCIMMPRVRFQAKLHYKRLSDGRILMLDEYDRQWSVFGSSADEVLPAMTNGVIEAWWVMAKKGNAYGLTVDLKQALMARILPNQNIPLMLEKANDLKTVMSDFEAMAV